MNMTRFNMTKDINGLNGFGLPISNSKYSVFLTAETGETLTIPSTGDSIYPNVLAIIIPQTGGTVWMAVNETAAIPVSGTFSESTSECNPGSRYVKPGDVLSFITSDPTLELGVILYAIT